MYIVKLKLKRINTSWRLGEICLDRENQETKSFDLDNVRDDVKIGIIRANEVFKLIDIIEVDTGPEIELYPIDGDIPKLPHFDSTTSYEDRRKPKYVVRPLKITEDDRDKAKVLLAKKVYVVKETVEGFGKTHEEKCFVLCLLQEEQHGKNRKTLTKFLEEKFLEIPMGVDEYVRK